MVERARIVAWLRGVAIEGPQGLMRTYVVPVGDYNAEADGPDVDKLADAIERGEHMLEPAPAEAVDPAGECLQSEVAELRRTLAETEGRALAAEIEVGRLAEALRSAGRLDHLFTREERGEVQAAAEEMREEQGEIDDENDIDGPDGWVLASHLVYGGKGEGG